jgi:hypothetical protein
MDKNKILAEQNIEQVVKWKWDIVCNCKYRDGNWEIFNWESDTPQPSREEIEAEIPNYQTVLDNEATAKEEAKVEKANLKASAKAKLIAGEALTEAEANTIVL